MLSTSLVIGNFILDNSSLHCVSFLKQNSRLGLVRSALVTPVRNKACRLKVLQTTDYSFADCNPHYLTVSREVGYTAVLAQTSIT